MTKKKIAKNKLILFYRNNKKTIYGVIIGFLVGFCSMLLFMPERISKLENGEEPVLSFDEATITANQYYENLKSKLGFELLIEDVDKEILDNLYPTDNDIQSTVNKEMNDTISEYTEYYGYTEDDFIKENNLGSKEEFFNILLTNYKRSLYYQDYVRYTITDDDIEKYYNEMPSDSEIKYIGSPSEETCKSMLKDAKSGLSYDKILNKYRASVTYANLGYVSFDDEKVDEILITTASKIKTNSYATSCVAYNGNYVLVFKGEEKNKEPITSLQARIREKIKAEIITQDNENGNKIYNKSLIELRENHHLKFFDTRIKDSYDKFVKKYK